MPEPVSSESEVMQRAIALAMKGRGGVEPNPMVGCIIVKEGRIIGRGYHQKFGEAHAEPNALASCHEDTAGATAYVTMEPCSHREKKTPPCVPQLIAARLKRVVVGCLDPNPAVNGKGMEQLRLSGITAEHGLLADRTRQMNAAFFKRMENRRPYVTLKWAQSADGKVAGAGGTRLFLSNDKSLATVHGLRARCDAILVGIATVLTDNPLLTVRGVTTQRPLLRVVLDSNLRIPVSSQLIRSSAIGHLVVYCSQDTYRQRHAAIVALNAQGVEVTPLQTDATGGLSLEHLLDDLGGRAITHLLVEPGPKLAASFFQQNLADRVWVFRSPKRVDDATAPSMPAFTYPSTGEIAFESDRLNEYLNPHSPVFFSLSPSPDLEIVKRG